VRTIRAAVIGTGTMGRRHARALQESSGVDVVALADLDVERAREAAREAGVESVPVFGQYEEMLSALRPDCVAIATPDHLHVTPVLDALAAGCHVLVEKPLATTLPECDEIVAAARKTGLTVMVNYTHRWALPYAYAHERARAGELGTLEMVYARKDDSLDVIKMWPWLAQHSSCAAYLSSHDIDLVCWWAGCQIVEVFARGATGRLAQDGFDTYDAIQASVRFENGAIGTFESAWIYPTGFPTMTDSYIQLVGSAGMMTIDRRREIIEMGGSRGFEFPKLTLMSEIGGKLVGGFKDAVGHFVECVRNGAIPLVTLESSRHVAAVVEAIHASLRTGAAVSVSPALTAPLS
jgi:predicted dehydrogenase